MLKHLLLEVIGHVSGLSDTQLEQIERSLPATKALIDLLNQAHPIIEQAGTLAERRARNLRSEVLGIATSRMRRRLEQTVSKDPATAELLDRVVRRELDPATAAGELLSRHADG